MVSTSQTTHNPEIRNPEPNCFVGIITSLIYQENGNNLVEVKIQNNNSNCEDIFTLTVYCNVELDDKNINIINLNEFQFRLQEAFNYQFLVKIFHESSKIIFIEITRFRTLPPGIQRAVGGSQTPPPHNNPFG